MPDISFARDIRPLFREQDIDSMKDYGNFDLSQLGDVRAHAAQIYRRLAAKDMPCDKPWSDQNIVRFKAWMDSEMAE